MEKLNSFLTVVAGACLVYSAADILFTVYCWHYINCTEEGSFKESRKRLLTGKRTVFKWRGPIFMFALSLIWILA